MEERKPLEKVQKGTFLKKQAPASQYDKRGEIAGREERPPASRVPRSARRQAAQGRTPHFCDRPLTGIRQAPRTTGTQDPNLQKRGKGISNGSHCHHLDFPSQETRADGSQVPATGSPSGYQLLGRKEPPGCWLAPRTGV